MFKVIIHTNYHSFAEYDAIASAGYLADKAFEADVFEVLKKVYLTEDVSVAILKYGGYISEGTFHIMVSDSIKF